MYEVEAKVPIKRARFEEILTELASKGIASKPHAKKDAYYFFPKNGVVRSRTSGARSTFDIKYREVSDGVEKNVELEWLVADQEKWQSYLDKLGIKALVEKQKTGYSYDLKEATLELNEIEGLGYYLEIEVLVSKASEVELAKQKIEKLFKAWGYETHDFEKRSYLELLNHV